MASPEGFNAEPNEDFEKRMQRLYILPMVDELNKIKEMFPNLKSDSKLADLLSDLDYELNTMPESKMDEGNLDKEFQILRSTTEMLQDPNLSEEEKMAIAIKGIEAAD